MLYDLKKEGMIKKYGEETPIRVASIQKRRIATLMERYNVDHPSKIESVKIKKIETSRKHFNTDYSFQAKVVKEKIYQSHIKSGDWLPDDQISPFMIYYTHIHTKLQY
jgi:hypothetical protein